MGRPLEIDATMLFEALTRPLEWEASLDLDSGEVLLGSAWDADEDETDADRESLVEIPRLESRAEYDLMARFTEDVTEDDVRDQLALALDGRGAFGRFRRVVGAYPDLEAEWRRVRREWLTEEARRWLADLQIEAVLVGDEPAGPGVPPARASKPRAPRIGLLDVLLLGAPDGKTELLGGEVLRVFQAASPSEAHAVFKAVARDLCELHGTPWRNRLIEGRETFTLERARLRVDATRVELALEVSPALWRRFSGG